MKISNTQATGALWVNVRLNGKLYNMATGESATVASPHAYDQVVLSPGEEYEFATGDEILAVLQKESAEGNSGLVPNLSPAEYTKLYQNGPGE